MGSPRLPTLCVSELFPSLAQSIYVSSMAPSFFMRALWLCDASCLSLLWAQSLLLQRQTPRHDRERSHLASLGHKCEVNVSKHIKIYQDALTHPVLSQALTSSTLKSTLTKSQIFCVYIERSGKIDSKDFIST